MIKELLKKNQFQWIDVSTPQEADYQQLKDNYNLPYLLVQDCLKPEHLPKYEETEQGHFLMMRSFDQESGQHDTTIQELTRKIALFFNHELLITIHRVEFDYLKTVADKSLKTEHPRSLHAMVHQVVLAVIRTYEQPIEQLQEQYQNFEHEILAKKNERLSTIRIYHFRRKLFVLRHILKQTNDALYRGKSFWEDHYSMLQDLRENIDQLYFQLNDISDSFEHLFQLHISLNDQRANDVMKVLTVFSSILLPLNFMASFYGMNFTRLPGLDSSWALLGLSFIMLMISLLTFWYFRRKGWFRTARE